MKSFLPNFHAVVFGAGGGIGAAMASQLVATPNCSRLTLMGRNISKIQENVNTNGDTDIQLLQAEAFQKVFAINSFGPALLIMHFLPFSPRHQRSVFGSLSARVGSISDNKSGGWYAYRASKAAHNMLIKTASLEARMKYKQAVIVGLHPGTVATNLSAPFRGNVSPEKLFTPSQSADYLLGVMDNLTIEQSGSVFAWDGQEIPA